MSQVKQVVEGAQATMKDLMAQADRAREAGYMVNVLIEQRNNAQNLAAQMQVQANIKAEELLAANRTIKDFGEKLDALDREAKANYGALEKEKGDLAVRLSSSNGRIAELIEEAKTAATRIQELEDARTVIAGDKRLLEEKLDKFDNENDNLLDENQHLKRVLRANGITSWPAVGAHVPVKKAKASAKPRAVVTKKAKGVTSADVRAL